MPDADFGGHDVPGAHNHNDGIAYVHDGPDLLNPPLSYFYQYFIGDSYPQDGLFIVDGRIVTKDTPGPTTGAQTDPSAAQYDPPKPFEIMNGDFEYEDSTAGWWYHGSDSDENLGSVENGKLLLNAGEHRTHNWAYVPVEAKTIQFTVSGNDAAIGSQLDVRWIYPDGSSTRLARTKLMAADEEQSYVFSLPPALPGSVGQLRLELESICDGSELPVVSVDDIHWSDAGAFSSRSAELASLTFDGPGSDVILVLEGVPAGQTVEVFAGPTWARMPSFGSFTNTTGAPMWTVPLDIGTAGVGAVKYVAVTGNPGLSIKSADGLYPDVTSLAGYESRPVDPAASVDLSLRDVIDITKLYLWDWESETYEEFLNNEDLSQKLIGKKNILLTHGWNDSVTLADEEHFLYQFALDFVRGRAPEDYGEYNIWAVDWLGEGWEHLLGSNPNGLPTWADMIQSPPVLGGWADANLSASNGIVQGLLVGERLASAGLNPATTMLIGHSNGAGFMAGVARTLYEYSDAPENRVAELVALDAPWLTASYWYTQSSVYATQRISNYYIPAGQLTDPTNSLYVPPFASIFSMQLGAVRR